MFQNARWITGCFNGKNGYNGYADFGSLLLRKDFFLSAPPEKATLYVCGLGYGEYTVNGLSVTEDELSTPFTKFDETVFYLTYDVTKQIVGGRNTIGVFLGNGWYNDVGSVWNYDTASWRSHPKLLLQLDITLTDGTLVQIISDTTWRAAKGPSVSNHIREGEKYDARLEQDGWNRPGFDDGEWEKVFITRSPGGKLLPMEMPPIRVIKTLIPIYLGNGVYDFGENTAGRINIKVFGDCGHMVEFHYSERYLDGDIDNAHIASFCKNELKQCDQYILNAHGTQSWHPHFVYHGFRYVKVVNPPTALEIQAEVLYTKNRAVGQFECKNDLLNKIHEASVRSIATNYHSIPTDCPHREQNGWTGDACLSCQQTLMNFDMYESYKKWMNDFCDCQRPDGSLPGIVPTSNWGYNWGNGPAWDSAIILIPWQTYQITGNDGLIRMMWKPMQKYFAYITSMSDKYIVDFGLSDWCAPKNAVLCPSAVTDTAIYYALACAMQKCAKLLGDSDFDYGTVAEKIKDAFREEFLFRPEYEKSQTFLSCCIYFKLYTEIEMPAKAKTLAELVKNNGYHIDCGILGTKYIFSALSDYGYTDVAYKMVTVPTCPSYAYWISQDQTTLCESWEMLTSNNHHMFSEVEHWFYRYLAGIQIDENGLVIKPAYLKEAGNIKAIVRKIGVFIDEKQIRIITDRNCTLYLPYETISLKAGEHAFPLVQKQ